MTSWQTKKLGDMSTLITSGSRGWASYYADSGAKFIRMTNLSRDDIQLSQKDMKHVKVPQDNSEGTRTKLTDGDILISITAELGKIGLVTADIGDAYINQHIALVRINKNEALPKMIAYSLSTREARNRLNRRNDSGAKAGLNLTTIQKFPVSLPDKPEQERIVKVLEIWDEYIEGLERKIELKEQLKKGLMQQLLTGKQRLPGFNNSWQEVRISELVELKKGSGLSKEQLSEEGKGCILYGEIYTKYDVIIDHIISHTKSAAGVSSKHNDILIPASTTTSNLDIATATCITKDYILLGGDINILRPKVPLNGKFLAILLSNAEKHNLAKRAQGITIVHLYGKDIARMKIKLPDINEQNEIVDVYEIIRGELKMLRGSLEQLKLQKNYLLKNLITGTIRTPENLKSYET